MEMSVQEFLNSVSNPRTRKGYRFGLNKFVEWFGKPAEEILAMRQEDLTQKPGENLVEYRNRAVISAVRGIMTFQGQVLVIALSQTKL